MVHRPTKQNICRAVHDFLLDSMSWPPLGKLNRQVVDAKIELMVEMRRRTGPRARECKEWFPGLEKYYQEHFGE